MKKTFNLTLPALTAVAATLSLFSCSKKAATPVATPNAVSQEQKVANEGTAAPINLTPSTTQPRPAQVARLDETARTQAPQAQLNPAPKQPAAVEPAGACTTLTFSHKALKSHGSFEDCRQHRNLLTLPVAAKELNAKALCVRVDDKPVRFQLTGQGLVIGPVAGPDSSIRVRFCTGKARCAEDCTIPKEEFLEAIGGGDDSDGEEKPTIAHWDPNDRSQDDDVAAELEGQLRKELATQERLSLFKDWVGGTPAPATACAQGARVAKAK